MAWHLGEIAFIVWEVRPGELVSYIIYCGGEEDTEKD